MGDIGTNGITSKPNENNTEQSDWDVDVVIVGAGFAGVYLLYQLRKQGLKVKLVEAGSGLGGVWHWNSYPGARTDTPVSTYALNIPEVYNSWTWTETYPGEQEIKAYFRHIDQVCGLSKDVIYNEKVTKATFDQSADRWHVQTDRGTTLTGRFYIPCLGFASKRFDPDWPGLRTQYGGQIIHPNDWPSGGLSLQGKKVAVVGTGATGIQISQEAARRAQHLTCFVRTPNLSWPMRNSSIDPVQAKKERHLLPYQLGEQRFTTVGGFLFTDTTRMIMDDTPEQQEAVLEEMYASGGFRVFFEGYIDVLGTQEGNDVIYNFWRRKTHERMNDKKKAEILAPAKSPHAFAGKRPSLEQDYYELMDQSHVTLVDASKNYITEVVEKGIVTSDGTVHEADVIILATGYDAITGGFREIEMTGIDGITLEEKWQESTTSYLGLMISGFPNMFYTYGPLSPVAYATGPAVVESQAHWIMDVMAKMKENGATRVEATREAEQEWRQKIDAIHAWTLREGIKGSWYQG